MKREDLEHDLRSVAAELDALQTHVYRVFGPVELYESLHDCWTRLSNLERQLGEEGVDAEAPNATQHCSGDALVTQYSVPRTIPPPAPPVEEARLVPMPTVIIDASIDPFT